jgi:hypothetical protein
MDEDYKVIIDDLEIEVDEIAVLENAIKHTIDRALIVRVEETQLPGGLEIDVDPEWADVLHNDSSILTDYEEIGWKVMWYNKHSLGPGRGDLVRSWLSFRSEASASKER